MDPKQTLIEEIDLLMDNKEAVAALRQYVKENLPEEDVPEVFAFSLLMSELCARQDFHPATFVDVLLFMLSGIAQSMIEVTKPMFSYASRVEDLKQPVDI